MIFIRENDIKDILNTSHRRNLHQTPYIQYYPPTKIHLEFSENYRNDAL